MGAKKVPPGSRDLALLEEAFGPPQPYRPQRLPGPQGTYTWGDALWFEERIGDWIAAYRLLPRHGQPEIAEVRVFPVEDRRPGPGLWSGRKRAVPPGGIRSGVLDHVSTRRPLELVPRVLADWEREHGAGSASRTIRRAGFTSAIRQPPTRPGRRGTPDIFYTQVASVYVDVCDEGSPHPLQDTAARLGGGWGAQEVRDALKEARKRELLTTLGRGRAGGQLTKKARDLLPKAARGRRKKG